MQQVYINPYEKVGSTDMNNLQLAANQSLFDHTLYNLFSKNNGVLPGGFLATYNSAYSVTLSAGVGFFYDSSQTGFTPKYRMINSLGLTIPVVITTADPTNNRIDLICLAPNNQVTATAARYVKTGGTGPITLTTVNKVLTDKYTLQVVAGTPSGSPAVPATPAGYIAIAQVLVTAATGMTGAGAITDVRNILKTSSLSVATYAGVVTVPASIDVMLFNPGANFVATIASVASNSGHIIIAKNIALGSGFNVTLTPQGGDNIENGGSGVGTVLTPGDSISLIGDTVNTYWQIGA